MAFKILLVVLLAVSLGLSNCQDAAMRQSKLRNLQKKLCDYLITYSNVKLNKIVGTCGPENEDCEKKVDKIINLMEETLKLCKDNSGLSNRHNNEGSARFERAISKWHQIHNKVCETHIRSKYSEDTLEKVELCQAEYGLPGGNCDKEIYNTTKFVEVYSRKCQPGYNIHSDPKYAACINKIRQDPVIMKRTQEVWARERKMSREERAKEMEQVMACMEKAISG